MQNVIPWKIIAIFGGSGAILSILVGIINRVGFGTILFRGLFLGVICAGVGYGIWFITRRYLPELFQEAKEPTEEGDESEQKGATIDISLEEGGPDMSIYSGTTEEGSADEEAMEMESAEDAEDIPELGGEEGEENEEPASVSVKPAKGSAGPSLGDKTAASEADVDFNTLDKLPALDSFSDSFAPGSGSSGGGGSGMTDETQGYSGSGSSHGGMFGPSKDAIDTLGADNDPASLAKAIQTMLKKDQKG